jgi:hypothetical protein
MPSTALTISLAFGLNFFLLLVVLALFNHLGKEIRMFKDDVTTALATQTTAIDALKTRVPAPPDPATIVPVADQTAILSGIATNTAAINAIDPAAPAPTPTPAPAP